MSGPCCNSASNPGIFVVNSGTFALNGNFTFYGIVYALNAQGAVGCVPACPVSLDGTAAIRGGVHIDGSGGLSAGSSKINIVYDDFAYQKVESYGAASLVQNKWREIPPRLGA